MKPTKGWRGVAEIGKMLTPTLISIAAGIAQKKKYKGDGSRTVTMRKKKKSGVLTSSHNDMSLHKLPAVGFHNRPIKSRIGKIHFKENRSSIQSNTQGRQCYGALEVLFTRDKCIGTTSTTPDDPYKSAVDFFELNTNSTRDNNALFVAASPSVERTNLMGVRKVRCEFNFLSMETVPQKVELYMLTPMFDTNRTPQEAYDAMKGRASYGLSAVTGRATVIAGSSVGHELLQTIGASFDHGTGLGREWKIMSKKTFVLQPGDSVAFFQNVTFNKYISREILLDARTKTFLKGITIVPYMIAYAGLVGNGTNIAESNYVYNGSTKIGVTSVYDYSLVFPSSPSLPVSVIASDLLVDQTDQKIIDDNDDIDIVVKN